MNASQPPAPSFARTPLVTVIVPVFNAGEYLLPAVESLVAQTYRHLEIIVVDDGSTDGCVETLRELRDDRMTIVRQPNGGKSTAMNLALTRLRGEFWGIQDADDLSHPDRIERQVEALLEDPTLAAVYSGIDLILDGKRFAPISTEKSRATCRSEIDKLRIPAHDATGLYRAALLRDLTFDPSLRIGQGVDFMFRVGERHPIKVLGACLYSHRINRASTTHRSASRNVEQLNRVIAKACARRGLDFARFRRRPPPEKTFFRHRSVDTIVPYAVESVKQLKADRRHREAFRTAAISARLHPLDPLYYKPLLHLVVPALLGRWWSVMRGRTVPSRNLALRPRASAP